MLGDGDHAVAVGLEYLRHVGINWAARPSQQEAHREYERIWSQLGRREIEDLIDLPLIKDPESRATLDVLTTLGAPTLYTDENLYMLTMCRAVNLSLEHGNCEAAPANYVSVGLIASNRFGHYDAGYRLGKLACDLTERRGLQRLSGKTYSVFALVVPWTRPLRESVDPARRAFQMANEQGDPTFAAYAYRNISSNLLASGAPLDRVEREAELGLEFARTVGFGFAADMMSAPLALVRTLRSEAAKFGAFEVGPVQEQVTSNSHASIVFLTGTNDVPSTVLAMKSGAVDFLTKPVSEEALLRAVDTAIATTRAQRREAAEAAALRALYETLTPREQELLPLLVGGMMNKQAADVLGISEYTVQVHRGHIMRKMRARSFATLVRQASRLELETSPGAEKGKLRAPAKSSFHSS